MDWSAQPKSIHAVNLKNLVIICVILFCAHKIPEADAGCAFGKGDQETVVETHLADFLATSLESFTEIPVCGMTITKGKL